MGGGSQGCSLLLQSHSHLVSCGVHSPPPLTRWRGIVLTINLIHVAGESEHGTRTHARVEGCPSEFAIVVGWRKATSLQRIFHVPPGCASVHRGTDNAACPAQTAQVVAMLATKRQRLALNQKLSAACEHRFSDNQQGFVGDGEGVHRGEHGFSFDSGFLVALTFSWQIYKKQINSFGDCCCVPIPAC